jgi:hypothetical protein
MVPRSPSPHAVAAIFATVLGCQLLPPCAVSILSSFSLAAIAERVALFLRSRTYCASCGLSEGSRSCEVTEIEIRSRTYERVRYVPRGEWERDAFPDRDIWWGNFHHIGCEMEQCPACKGPCLPVASSRISAH